MRLKREGGRWARGEADKGAACMDERNWLRMNFKQHVRYVFA